MNRWIPLLTLGSLAGLSAQRQFDLEARLIEIENTPSANPQEVTRLEGRLEAVQSDLIDSQVELEHARSDARAAAGLATRVELMESDLRVTIDDLVVQREELESWRSSREASVDMGEIDTRIATLNSGWESNWSDLQELAVQAVDMARGTQTALEHLAREVEPEPQNDRWPRLVGPIVQLAGARTVGSGVLLEPVLSAPGEYTNWLLTCWHVIRDIQADFDDPNDPIPVTVYAPDGSTHTELAELLEHDVDVDIALLRLLTRSPMPYGARLASRKKAEELQVFSKICAVGCPLGNDPIPTWGQLTDLAHDVQGDRYWMISAPTYVGNSGGGIFTGDSYELVGIFSKIYTHGTLRPTVVPHMGLVTPLDRVYDWLDEVGYGDLEAQDDPPTSKPDPAAMTFGPDNSAR